MRDPLIYTCNDIECMVGDGSSKPYNGIKDLCYSDILEIPKFHNRKKITSLGQHAFRECYCLKYVIIKAEITSIGDSCFEACSNLTAINIPSTVTYIGRVALTCYNRFNVSGAEYGYNSIGTFTITFEPNSKLKNLGEGVFGRKEHYVIKINDEFNGLTCNQTLYYSVSSFTIYSTKSFEFCGTKTTVVPMIDLYSEYNIMNDSLLKRKHFTCQRKKTRNDCLLLVLLVMQQ